MLLGIGLHLLTSQYTFRLFLYLYSYIFVIESGGWEKTLCGHAARYSEVWGGDGGMRGGGRERGRKQFCA